MLRGDPIRNVLLATGDLTRQSRTFDLMALAGLDGKRF